MSRRRYLVAYDIRESKRLRDVHACMKRYGHALQYSVFLCDLDGMEKLSMKLDLHAVINEREDSVALVDLGDPRRQGMDCFEFLGVTLGLPRGGPTIV
jgi:CRISPR-associated protein Cas2